ncbi:MAG: XRE family transcriptional regulator [Rhizobiaceae bacterium]
MLADTLPRALRWLATVTSRSRVSIATRERREKTAGHKETKEDSMITGSQCRAARALVEITRGKLCIRSGIDETVIQDFERKLDKPDDRTIDALKTALEELGAVFIDENGGGIGVRLKFTESEAKRIARLEGEGGIVANDRVP